MDSRQILLRAINDTLDLWQSLDSDHKGPSYEEAVKSLTEWKEDLQKSS